MALWIPFTLLFSALVAGLLPLVALWRGEREVAQVQAMAGDLLISIPIGGSHAHAPAS
jgi:hypothetical protein